LSPLFSGYYYPFNVGVIIEIWMILSTEWRWMEN